MTAIPEYALDEWSRGLTPRRRLLMEICSRLDDEEVEQMLFTDEICEICFEPKMGILDEGKLRQPLPKVLGGPGLYQYYFGEGKGRSNATYLLPSSGKTVRGLMTDYEICQSIVMTGLYSRSQLGLSKLNNHELEVCERRFTEIRPLRCGCDFGSPTEEQFSDFVSSRGQYGALVPVDGLTAVEHSFVSGKPVRTGYRRRSLDAVRRRRLAYRQRKASPIVKSGVIPRPLPGFPLSEVSSEPVELRFNFIPFGKRSRPYKRVAKEILSFRREVKVKKLHKQSSYFVKPNLVLPRFQVRLPEPSHKKYWYFLRKRGRYYHSIHHPYGDELSREAQVVISDFPT